MSETTVLVSVSVSVVTEKKTGFGRPLMTTPFDVSG